MHGLGGNIMEFFGFLSHLQSRHPVYGLQARGTDGLEEPCSSVEGMAKDHLEAIKLVQSRGPYILIGYSLGGLVALEIARSLSEAAEHIALLVMIDSYPPLRYAPLSQQVQVYSRRAGDYAARLFRGAASKTLHGSFQDGSRTVGPDNSLGIPFTPAMLRVQEASTKALRDYQPRHYAGRIRFIRAGTPLHFPDDPPKVWTKFTDRLELETVPGNHHELLTTHCDGLAAVISRYLRELPGEIVTGSFPT